MANLEPVREGRRGHRRLAGARLGRRGRLAAALIPVALVAAACTGTAGEATTTTSPPPPGATTTTTPAPHALRVVATTTILGDLATGVVGDRGSVEVLMPVGADPHDFSPSSRQVARMQEADLVVANGLDLEESLIPVLEAIEDAGTRVLWMAPLLDPIPFTLGGSDHDDGHDNDHGHEDDDGHDNDHDHSDLDPHVWMDPQRMATAARLLADALAQVAPEVDWAEAAEAYAAEMMAVDAEIMGLVADLPAGHRLLVTNHHSLGYFADRYGFEVVGTVIPGSTTLGAPSSADLSRLVDLIDDLGIPAIFAETIDATSLAEALAAEAQRPVAVVVLTTDSLGEPGTEAETLSGLLLSNTRLIVEALR